MKKQLNLIYKLNGSAVDEGVDVFELSPLLLHIGQLIQDSNKLVHPDGHEIGVNIKPFRKGSFIIELTLFAQNNLQQVMEAFNSDAVKETKEVLEWLGIIGSTSYGVVKIYRFLKGAPKKIENISKNEIRITAKDNTTITVSKEVGLLFQNTSVQQNIYHIYGEFLGREGVDSVESKLTDVDESSVIIKKEEVSFFNPANAIPEEGENIRRNITRAFLKPKRISVEGESDNWSLRKGEGVIITANIKDKDFLEKIRLGEIRLYKEDLLEVDLLEIQEISSNNEVSVKYEVLHVHDYKQAPIQSTLLD